MIADTLDAVAIVLTSPPSGSSVVSGTAFLFRHEHIALTASHCVVENGAQVDLVLPRLGRSQRVLRVERHPSADVAMLVTDPAAPGRSEGPPLIAFWDRVANWGLGEEFLAYGFPSRSAPITDPESAVPRLFVGHYQRFFLYESPSKRRYLAGEMSLPAPAGLSGGPLFRRGAPQMVTGIVTANHESYAITDSFEEVRDGGTLYQLESRKIISYGIALMLSGVDEWLREVVPPREGLDWIS